MATQVQWHSGTARMRLVPWHHGTTGSSPPRNQEKRAVYRHHRWRAAAASQKQHTSYTTCMHDLNLKFVPNQ
jgi:hypothetical protein